MGVCSRYVSWLLKGMPGGGTCPGMFLSRPASLITVLTCPDPSFPEKNTLLEPLL